MAADSSHMYHLLTIILVVWASHFLTPTAVAAINIPAHFIQKYSLYSVKRGDSAKLVCESFGSRPITIQWLRQESSDSQLTPLAIPIFGTTEFGSSGSASSSSPSSSSSSSSSYSSSEEVTKFNPLSSSSLSQPDQRRGGSERQLPEESRLLSSPRFNAFQKDFSGPDERTSFELHIMSTQLSDSALYVCKISNEFGDDTRNMELTILDVPSAPQNITIDGIWSRGISLTWTPSRTDGNSLITEYMIQYWKEDAPGVSSAASPSADAPHSSPFPSASSSAAAGDSSSNMATSRWSASSSSWATHAVMSEEEVSSSVTSHVIRDKLSPGTRYALRMLGRNQFGWGAPSDVVAFVTKSESPSFPPTDISCESMGSTAIVIKWKPPPREHWNGQLKGYRVGYRVLSSPPSFLPPAAPSPSLSPSPASSSSLYQGALSNSLAAELERGGSGANDASLIEKMYTFKEVAFSAIPSEEQQLILTGLSKATTYGLIVCPFNDAGSGPFSHQVIVSTSSNDPPEAPALYVVEVTDNSIRLKWDQARNPQDLTHYTLYYKDERSAWMEIAFPVPEEKEYELSNLNKGNQYQLYMRAVSRRGTSDPSDVLTVRTESEAAAPSIVSSQAASIGVNSFFTHTNSHPFGMGMSDGPSPSPSSTSGPAYMGSVFVIYVAIAVMIVVIACSVAFVYIRFEEKKVALIQAGYTHAMMSQSASRNFQYMSGCPSPSSTSIPSRVMAGGSIVSEEGTLTLRYSDPAGRPLLARPPIPTVLWAQQQGPIREEDSDGMSSCNPYSTLPFQRRMSLMETHIPHRTEGPPPLPGLPPSKSQRFSGCTFGHSLSPTPSPEVPSNASKNVHRVFADLHHHQKDQMRDEATVNEPNDESCNYYDVNNGSSDQNSGQSTELLPAATFSSSDHLVSRTSQI